MHRLARTIYNNGDGNNTAPEPPTDPSATPDKIRQIPPCQIPPRRSLRLQGSSSSTKQCSIRREQDPIRTKGSGCAAAPPSTQSEGRKIRSNTKGQFVRKIRSDAKGQFVCTSPQGRSNTNTIRSSATYQQQRCSTNLNRLIKKHQPWRNH